MKVIIAGHKDINDIKLIDKIIKGFDFNISKIISAGLTDFDKIVEIWALKNKVSCEVVSVNWDMHGKIARYVQKETMTKLAEAIIIIKNKKDNDKEVNNLINVSKRNNLKIFIKEI